MSLAGWNGPRLGPTVVFGCSLNHYYGYSPYGQFFGTKLEMVGFGLYLSF